MLLKTILNYVEKHPLFVYGTPKMITDDGSKRIEIPIKARKGSKGICSVCLKPAPGYDTQQMRKFSFIPFWGFLVFFLYDNRHFYDALLVRILGNFQRYVLARSVSAVHAVNNTNRDSLEK